MPELPMIMNIFPNNVLMFRWPKSCEQFQEVHIKSWLVPDQQTEQSLQTHLVPPHPPPELIRDQVFTEITLSKMISWWWASPWVCGDLYWFLLDFTSRLTDVLRPDTRSGQDSSDSTFGPIRELPWRFGPIRGWAGQVSANPSRIHTQDVSV